MPDLRDIESSDLDRVLSINQDARPAVGDLDRDRVAHLVGESSIALVAEVGSTVVGFCLVLAPNADYDSVNYTWFSARYRDFIYLDRVAIVPEHRGRGLGRALYAEVERLAKLRTPDAITFTLEVNLRPRNEASLEFHTRLGFTEVGRQETPYGAEVSLMAKSLP